jgi:hypothetical protein
MYLVWSFAFGKTPEANPRSEFATGSCAKDWRGAEQPGPERSQNCDAVLLLEFASQTPRLDTWLVSGVEFCRRQNSGSNCRFAAITQPRKAWFSV